MNFETFDSSQRALWVHGIESVLVSLKKGEEEQNVSRHSSRRSMKHSSRQHRKSRDEQIDDLDVASAAGDQEESTGDLYGVGSAVAGLNLETSTVGNRGNISNGHREYDPAQVCPKSPQVLVK